MFAVEHLLDGRFRVIKSATEVIDRVRVHVNEKLREVTQIVVADDTRLFRRLGE
jgi:hypothetical protein